MIDISEIKKSFPLSVQRHTRQMEYMLKEYFQYRMLDIIFNTRLANKLCFIGGTSIRILYNAERFSEDLDFDCFRLNRDEFMQLTDEIIHKIRQAGINVEADDKKKDEKLTAFRRNIVFPQLLYNLNLSGHKEKKFLIKIEAEPHNYDYSPVKPVIQKFNIFTQIYAAPSDVLLSMKLAAAMDRQKGRDFYDCILLMGKTTPDWKYLNQKFNITTPDELKRRLMDLTENTNFDLKAKEFEKLIFNPEESRKIKHFRDYISQKKF